MKLADLRVRTEGETVIADVRGEIDMSNAGEILAALADGTPNHAAGLIVDLSGLDYLDSAGIQLLLRLQSALRSRSQALVLLVPVDSPIRQTFRLAGIGERIRLAGDLEAARTAIRD